MPRVNFNISKENLEILDKLCEKFVRNRTQMITYLIIKEWDEIES